MSNIITLGGKQFIIPELKFGIMKKLWPYIQPKDISGENAVNTVLEESDNILTICLQHFYPEISNTFIADEADFYEVQDALLIIRPMIQDAVTKKKNQVHTIVNPENLLNGTGEESTHA